MSSASRTRIDRPHDPELDEQLWPINLGILILAAIAAGFVGATSAFPDPTSLNITDPAVIQTGWGRLAAVALTALAAMLAVFGLQRWVARRVLFCLLVGLISHLWLGLYLHEQYLEVAAQRMEELKSLIAQEEQQTVVADYHVSQISPTEAPQSFEKPVEAEPPRESQPLEVEKEAKEHEVVAEQPAPVPQTLPEEPPAPLRMDRAENSVPLQADRAAGITLSRQPTPDRPEPNEPLPQPEVPQTTAAPEPTLAAQSALAQRRVEQAPTPEPAAQAQPDQPSASDTVVPRNRQADNLPEPGIPTATQRQISRASREHLNADLAMPLPAAAPSPSTSTEGPRGLQPGQASQVASRADRTLTSPQSAPGSPGDASEFVVAKVDARMGRPRPHTGERPDLESGGAGNPLSRSTRALPTVRADLPEPDQTASTGSGTGTRPDTDFDASVAGPTRRASGTTTEMTVGRISPEPPAGSFWADKAQPIPIRRAATVDASASPTGSSGGGRSPLARSAVAVEATGTGREGLPSATPADPSNVASSSGSTSPTPSARLEADSSAAVVQRQSPTGATGQQNLTRVSTGSAVAESSAVASRPEAASLPAQRGGGNQAMEDLLAGGSVASVPRQSLGRRHRLSADVPLSVDSPQAGPSRDPVQRPSAGPASSRAERVQAGPAVPIRQAPGPGGLSELPSPELGTPSRRARPESVVVHTSPGRFLLDRATGRPPLDASLMKPPAAAFKQRFPGQRNEIARKYGATESSDRAVEQGLYFLARCQFPDGRWAIDRLPPGVVDPAVDAGLGEMNADTAATGLALLAFLGKGYTHVDFKYRNQVNAGLRWLISNQQEDGSLFNDRSDQTLYAQFYAHGIASIALGEAYGMTWDEELRGPLQRAIAFTLNAQHPQRGGWRYRPRQETDTSVSGWHLMALKSAQMAGVEVPSESLARVSGWLDLAQAQNGSRYRYNPYALDTPAQRQGRIPSLAMTAEGLLMRFYLGRDRTHPETIAGADYLRDHLPGDPATPPDVYYLYYATQVMFQMQGDYWQAWNQKLRPRLEATQVQKGQLIGSWSPLEPARDRWGHAGGRLYMTAMNLLMLEVYYRHMPLFREID